MGQKEPFEDLEVTDGICGECVKKLEEKGVL